MRYAAALVVLFPFLLSHPGFAEEAASARLVGSWRLVSFKVQVVGEDAPPRDILGPHPFGRLIMTPEHTMAAYLSKPDRKPPANEAETAALVPSMVAYTGKFRVEGDRFITTVDGAWNEIFKANEQVRMFALDGDTLIIRIPEQPSGTLPGKRTSSVLVWEREK